MRMIELAAVAIFIAALQSSTAHADETLSKGAYLARAGDCVVCHSMSEGRAFAGGLKMTTPLGNIYSTNITPDKDAGIGSYSLDDFSRALRQGVGKDGHHLYPAMPYPSYAKLTDEDVAALYDYFMHEVEPVRQANIPSDIKWPLNMRWPLAVWNYLMTDRAAFQPSPEFDAEWNRGAYLVQGLGHCGACHTPRGPAFEEKALDQNSTAFLAGGTLDNWSAADLRGDGNAGLARWSEDDLFQFLKTGHTATTAAFGSMSEVIDYSLKFMTDDDLRAIAKYLKSLPPANSSNQAVWVYNDATASDFAAGKLDRPGAATYARQCASCHGSDGRGVNGAPALAGSPILLDPDPSSIIHIILDGRTHLEVQDISDPDWMPQFRTWLDDRDTADLVTFIRSAWGNRASATTADKIAEIRKETDPTTDNVVIYRMR
ncbi:MAG TPA: cytochrome c [Beijerinckiaceae bacterium]|nr:cytochrome c [Beijerinckiaceae bacterium]